MEAQDTRMENAILGILERLWRQTRSMDSGVRITTCKTCNRRLLDKVFKSKPIKRGGKIPSQQPKKSLKFQSTSTNIFPNCKQQHLYHGIYFPQSIHLMKTQQHGPSTSDEERIRGLDKVVS